MHLPIYIKLLELRTIRPRASRYILESFGSRGRSYISFIYTERCINFLSIKKSTLISPLQHPKYQLTLFTTYSTDPPTTQGGEQFTAYVSWRYPRPLFPKTGDAT